MQIEFSEKELLLLYKIAIHSDQDTNHDFDSILAKLYTAASKIEGFNEMLDKIAK